MIDRQIVEAKIVAMTAERDRFLDDVNRQLAAYSGALQMLETLLEEDAVPDREARP